VDAGGSGVPGGIRQPFLKDAVDGQRHPLAVRRDPVVGHFHVQPLLNLRRD